MRTVLVTGGSRGIGAACVKRFREAGDRVIFLYKTNDAAAEAVCSATGAEAIRCDVSDPAQTARILPRIGEIDVLVNNAGCAQTGLFQTMSDADWNRMTETHLGGAFRCIRAFLPGMIRRQSGCIVNISSMWGQTGASCEVAYSAVKAGLIGMTKALAKETGPSGIRVNCVAPGVIDTDMNAFLSPTDRQDLADQTPLGRIGTPDEAARAVFWLASDEASFVTGQVIGVNGGLVI